MLYFYRADLDKARLSCLSLQGDDYFGEPFLDHFRCKRPLTGYLSLDCTTLHKRSQIYRFKTYLIDYQDFFRKLVHGKNMEPTTNMALLKLYVKTIDDCFNDMNKRVHEPKQIFYEKCLKYGGAFLLTLV